jgi:hypothetical protein
MQGPDVPDTHTDASQFTFASVFAVHPPMLIELSPRRARSTVLPTAGTSIVLAM